MILNDLYTLFNTLIQGGVSDLTRKQLAINEGQMYLIKRMIELGVTPPQYFLSNPTTIATTAAQNYVSLPTDFMALKKIWYESGSDFLLLSPERILTYDDLLDRADLTFFDSTNTGEPNYAAVKNPYIYFDRYFVGDGTDDIKVLYWKRPTTLELYDKLTSSDISADFTIGETVTGGTSGATATVNSQAATYINVNLTDQVGTFVVGEVITGSTSASTASISSITSKPQVTDWIDNDKMIVAQAAKVIYLNFINSNELESASVVLDNLINNNEIVITNNETSTWRIY